MLIQGQCKSIYCDRKAVARGMCDKHWRRWAKGDDIDTKSQKEMTKEERFWAKVAVQGPNDCWLWTASTKGRAGMQYGVIDTTYAHRYSYEMHNGPIPEGLCVLHICDNPLCVNPQHLYLGTHADNMQDKVEKGRDGNSNKTHCPHGHKYAPENTYYTKGRSRMRHCRTCHRLRERERRQRQRRAVGG